MISPRQREYDRDIQNIGTRERRRRGGGIGGEKLNSTAIVAKLQRFFRTLPGVTPLAMICAICLAMICALCLAMICALVVARQVAVASCKLQVASIAQYNQAYQQLASQTAKHLCKTSFTCKLLPNQKFWVTFLGPSDPDIAFVVRCGSRILCRGVCESESASAKWADLEGQLHQKILER